MVDLLQGDDSGLYRLEINVNITGRVSDNLSKGFSLLFMLHSKIVPLSGADQVIGVGSWGVGAL